MVELAKMEPQHLEELIAAGGAQMLASVATDEQLGTIAAAPYSFSGINEFGRVIFCGGVAVRWPGRGEAWISFNPDCKREFLSAHNVVRNFLDSCPVNRIEASVKADFEAGHRWIELLGFTLEAETMMAYGPDGGDYSLYAKVKNG